MGKQAFTVKDAAGLVKCFYFCICSGATFAALKEQSCTVVRQQKSRFLWRDAARSEKSSCGVTPLSLFEMGQFSDESRDMVCHSSLVFLPKHHIKC